MKSKVDKLLGIILIFCIVGCVVSFRVYQVKNKDRISDYKKSRKIYSTIQSVEDLKPKVSKKAKIKVPQIDFKKLLSINTDIKFYLKLRGTDIKYPVVQGSDNDFYSHRLVTKERNYGGSLMLDCRCKTDPQNNTLIVYGHNMKDGSMFGNLDKFRDTGYLLKHKDVWLISKQYAYLFKIEKCVITSKDSKLYKTKKRGKLLLSTCAYEGKDSRLVLVCNLAGIF